MGPQDGERGEATETVCSVSDWVDVANDLFSKCHINLTVRKLTECDANVFIALYENILGEKVPDYIARPHSQEDDIHNVQSVIDSLSLDYLQISLSHITGENVVREDKESIKNLLEIFDGLLEYLNEEINEDSQNSEELNHSLGGDAPREKNGSTIYSDTEHKETKMEGASLSPTGESPAQSSKHSLHSWNCEEVGSASEIIGLGVSARTFTGLAVPPQTSGAINTTGPLDTQEDAPVTQPLHVAIPLQPPSQSNTPHSPNTDPRKHTQSSNAAGLSQQTEGETATVTTEIQKPVGETIVSNGLQSPPLCQSPAVSEKSVSSQQRTRTDMEEEEEEAQEPVNGGPRRVLFRTQPDVLFLTLQDEVAATTPSPPHTEEEEEEETLCFPQTLQSKRRLHRERTEYSNALEMEDALSYRRQRNRKAEEELHHISENLSHRLEELDEMLKRVMGETGELSEVREEDKPSHHSDSSTEDYKTPKQHRGTLDVKSTQRTCSLSPSPPRVHCSQPEQLEIAMAEALSLDDGRQTNLAPSGHSRRGESRHRRSHRKHSKHLENKAYEEELKRYEDKEQTHLDKERLKAQEAEREYREAILTDISQAKRLSPVTKKTQHKSRRHTRAAPLCRQQDVPRNAPSMKVKENELLPVLLEEMPRLHITPQALGRMWEQQMQQVDRLHTLSSSHHSHQRRKRNSELEEAHRKHDLLVDIVRKEQDHKRRLRDFKERIQQQKSTQNRLREQRQQVARAKKYHNDYHVQHRARLMRARTKEEQMFRKLFEEGLELQKVRLREQRAYAREKQLERQRRHQDHIKSMENYYKDQFSLLAEKLAHERQELQVRKKAQEKALLKMKRELHSRMEREIGELQKIIIQNDEEDYFENLEVQRLRSRMHVASFQYNTSYLH